MAWAYMRLILRIYALPCPSLAAEPICSTAAGQFMRCAGAQVRLSLRALQCCWASAPSLAHNCRPALLLSNDLVYRHTSMRSPQSSSVSRASPHSTGLDRKIAPRRCHSRKHAVMKDAAAPSAHESQDATDARDTLKIRLQWPHARGVAQFLPAEVLH